MFLQLVYTLPMFLRIRKCFTTLHYHYSCVFEFFFYPLLGKEEIKQTTFGLLYMQVYFLFGTKNAYFVYFILHCISSTVYNFFTQILHNLSVKKHTKLYFKGTTHNNAAKCQRSMNMNMSEYACEKA